MIVAKKDNQKVEKKEWENPLDPEHPADERNQEQLQRQYKEAKRRNENLTGDGNNKQTKN